MKKITHFIVTRVFCAISLLLLLSPCIHAQMFFNSTNTGASNTLPFQATSTSKRVQFIATPGMFSGIASGLIHKIYFRSFVNGTTATYSNLVISLGNSPTNPLSATSYYTTGMQTCLSKASYAITNITAGGWIVIPLDIPFYYDHTQNLIVDIQSTAVTNGFSISQHTLMAAPARCIGPIAAPIAADALTPDFGFDIKSYNDAGALSVDSPSLLSYGPGLKDVYVTIKNHGLNRIMSATVNWSVGGALQTPYVWSGMLDTAGGSGSRTAGINIGSYTFPADNSLIKVWTSLPNSVVDTMPNNDSFSVIRRLPMSGVFTINPSGSGTRNFTTFAAAVLALQQVGVNGPVTFDVGAGTYNEQVNLVGPIPGVNTTNTLTFDGGNGNAASRIITYAGIATAYQTVQISNVPYTTFRNLSINGTSSTYAFGVLINGSSNGSRISNCLINIPVIAASSTNHHGIVAGGSPTSYAAGARVDSLMIDSNTITGGSYGITLSSTTYSFQNVCRNNTVYNFTGGGLFVGTQKGLIVSDNIIRKGTTTTAAGIYLNTVTNNVANLVMITGNKVINTATSMVVSGSNDIGRKGVIANNVLGGGYVSPATYGVSLSGNNWDIVNNSFNKDTVATAATYSNLYIPSGTGITILNNIFSVKRTLNAALPLYVTTATSVDTMNYNIFYREDTLDNKLVYLGANYNSGSFIGAGGFNLNSIYLNPSYVNDTNMHIPNGCFKGQTITYIANDIEGNPRPVLPTIGAYEYLPAATDLAVYQLMKPTVPAQPGPQDLEVMVRNPGTNIVTSFTVSYTLNGNAPVSKTVTGTFMPCDTIRVVFTGAQQLSMALGFNSLKVYTGSPNGGADNKPGNDTLQKGIYTPLNGSYTINPLGSGLTNFVSFSAAATALQGGILGPVVFNVAAGTYNEQVNLAGPFGGVSATNTITFDGGNGNAASRIITNKGISTSFHTVQISASPYTTFRNLTIKATDSAYAFGILITGTSQRSRISNCVISTPENINVRNIAGMVIGGTPTSFNATISRVDSLDIDSNTITGGYFGIVDTSASAYSTQNKFRNNNVLNFYYMGAFFNKQQGMQILNNTIIGSPACSTTCMGMNLNNMLNNGVNATMIIGNRINSVGGSAFTLNTSTGAAGRKIQILNNMFGAGSKTNISPLVSIQTASNTGYMIIANNTFHSDGITIGAGGGSLYMKIGIGMTITNNIFSVKHNDNLGLPLYLDNITADSMDYNIVYRQDTSNHQLMYLNGTYYNTGNFIGALGFNTHSVFALPGFINDTNLRVTNPCATRGMALSYITTDIDGISRGTTPTIGASEVAVISDNIGPAAITSPSFPVVPGLQNLEVLVRNYGTNAVTAFSLNYRLNGGALNSKLWTGTLLSCDSVTIVFDAAQQIAIGNGINMVEVFTTGPNGIADGNRTNDTLRKQIAKPMTGTYTIGILPADSFPSFTSAIAALDVRGVGGPVVFKARSGVYTENVFLTAVKGASSVQPIQFTSADNNPDSVVLNANGLFPLTLSYASYCSFKNITIKQQSNSVGCINIIGNCTYDTLYNCKVLAPVFTSTQTSNMVIANLPLTGVVFRKNVFRGGYNGLVLTKGQGCIIDSNTFTDMLSGNLNVPGHKIRNNTFYFTAPPGLGPGSGVGIVAADSTLEFSNNTMYVKAASTGGGILIENVAGTPSNRVKVFNNKAVLETSQAVFSCNIGRNSSYIDVYNNIMPIVAGVVWRIGGTGTGQRYYNNTIRGSVGIFPGSNLEYKNNFSTMGILWANDPGAEIVDYNCYYGIWLSNGVTISLYTNGYGGSAITWPTYRSMPQFANQDRHTLVYLPVLDSLTFAPVVSDSSCWALNGRGIQIPDVPADVNNIARPTTLVQGAPDIGAYEFTPTSLPPAADANPVIPVAGSTQSFTFGYDTVAKITWAPASDVPAKVTVRQYSGEKPPAIVSSADYMYLHTTVDMPSPGPALAPNYQMALRYRDSWLGTVANPNESSVKLAKKVSTNSWLKIDTGTINVNTNTLSSNGHTELSVIFSGTNDLNPLPVNLLRFYGEQQENNVLLNWATATEKNSHHFEIERSVNGLNFENIDAVKAKGKSAVVIAYQYADRSPSLNSNILYYRLRMVDNDGSYTYSNTIAINRNVRTTGTISVFPNPFSDEAYAEITLKEAAIVNSSITDLTGKVMDKNSISFDSGYHVFTLPTNDLKPGIYFVNITQNGITSVHKIIKQ